MVMMRLVTDWPPPRFEAEVHSDLRARCAPRFAVTARPTPPLHAARTRGHGPNRERLADRSALALEAVASARCPQLNEPHLRHRSESTALVRSGVLTSVHAFASDPKRGVFILIFLAVVVGTSLMLFAWRAPRACAAAAMAKPMRPLDRFPT